MTRILPVNLDYTARDFDSLNSRLQNATDSVFTNWTDKQRANFGNILREMLAYVGDVLAYYQDAQAVESRFTTCTRRVNGIRHARALNYFFQRQTAATVDVTLTLRASYGEILVPARSVIRTASATNPVRVQVLEDTIIQAGWSQVTLPCENSLSWDTGFESDDSADQEFELPQTPFLSIVSATDDLGSFTEQSNFLDSGPNEAHYVILISEEDRARVRFGDGNQGRKPSGQVDIEFKTGGGSVNIDPGTLTVPEFSLQDEFGVAVGFDVSNPSASSGGLDRESLAVAQRLAPDAVTLNQRSVTHADYAAAAQLVTGVARALILTADQQTGLAENYGQLYVAALGTQLSSGAYLPAAPSSTILEQVETQIETNYPTTITFQYDVIASPFHSIDVTARVLLEQGASPTDVDAAVRAALQEFFAIQDADGNLSDTIKFGYEYKDELGAADPRLLWSDLFATVLNATGVRSVDEDLFQPFDHVAIGNNEIPTLGTVTLINDRTGLPLV